MTDRVPIIKAKANVPIKVELKWCDYSKSKTEGWADQLRLTGKMNGEEARIYVPLGLENELGQRGIIQRTGEDDRWGNPAFEVLSADPFELLKVERDDGKGFTYQVGAVAGTTHPRATPPAPRTASTASTPPSDVRLEVAWQDEIAYCLRTVRDAYNVAEMAKYAQPDPLERFAVSLFIERLRRGETLKREAAAEQPDEPPLPDYPEDMDEAPPF